MGGGEDSEQGHDGAGYEHEGAAGSAPVQVEVTMSREWAA
jgi:hypothetical protein